VSASWRGASQVVENAVYHLGLGDERDYAQRARRTEFLGVGRGPHSVVRVEPRVRPGEHASSRLDIDELALVASGPGAERFGGIMDNWEIGQLLFEAIAR
jgi:alkaline phosphatase